MSLCCLGLVAIAALTLTPGEGTTSVDHLCLFCGDLGGTDFFLNVLLFVPLGLGLSLLLPRGAWAFVIPAVISLTIELLQWRLIPGRDAALGDLIANSLGGAIGAAVVRWAAALFLPNTRQARRLAALGAALAAVVLTGVGALLTPAVPYLVHWVQWLPRKNGYDTFAGSLDSLQVNGAVLAAFDAVDPVFLPHVAAEDRNEVRAVVRPAAADPARIALIARLAAPMDERFMIGRYHDDFVYRVRLRAASAGFRVPIGALPDAFRRSDDATDGQSGSAVELEATLHRTGVMLRARGPGTDAERYVALSPAVAWAMVAPRDVPLGTGYEWANAGFLFALTVVPMYWIALSATPRAERGRTLEGRFKSTVILAIFLGALASVHILGGGAPFSPIEWTGVALAGVIGQIGGWIGHRARKRQVRVDTSWSADHEQA